MEEHGLNRMYVLLCILAIGVLVYALGLSFFAYSWSPGPNYINVTVDTKVNITGSPPVILTVTPENPITLNAGALQVITCNASIRDYNGFSDIINVNATVHFTGNSSAGAFDENNSHYTNSSRSVIGGSGFHVNYTCSFPLNYYAFNGTWNCTVRVNDSANLQGSRNNLFNISPFYAVNISRTLIDYGEVAASFFSNNISANISNIGNWPINVSVLGYATTIGDNLSFVCDQGNLTVDMQHFSINSSQDWLTKQALSSTYQAINSLSINKTYNANYSLNTSYWELYVNESQPAFGNCTGFIVFQASSAT